MLQNEFAILEVLRDTYGSDGLNLTYWLHSQTSENDEWDVNQGSKRPIDTYSVL